MDDSVNIANTTFLLMVAINFYSMEKWKSIATISCLVTNTLQNIFLCVQQKIMWANTERIFFFG